MSLIDICAFHQLKHRDAQQAADDLAADLAQKFAIDYGWDGNVIHFERQGVSGSITVGKREIRVKARLGLLLAILKGRIEEEITQYLQSHFGCTFGP
ncbi:MAG: polyhydroxyalkanoic acid system family protein [Lysobacterales bacterium]